jgi:hypothetical protein
MLWRAAHVGLVAVAAAGMLVAACVGNPGDDAADDEPAALPAAVRAPDGTLRVPYLGGAFVTKNREMPIEVQQAIAGEPTDHPVVVWVGD